MGVDTRNVPRDEILAALDEVGIADTWAPAGLLRGGLLGDGSNLGDLPRKAKLNAGFRNQVVGRIAERVFRLRHLSRLEPRFTIHDYHARGDNRDYGIANERVELPVNVKVASTLFRNARMFGLEPEDCIPISSYKALNAIRAVPDLVYVDLVDFTLRDKADALMDGMDGTLGVLWDLMSWYGGRGDRAAQDKYIDHLFDARGTELDALAPGVTSFRAISAKRVLAILRENPRRVPAGTARRAAEMEEAPAPAVGPIRRVVDHPNEGAGPWLPWTPTVRSWHFRHRRAWEGITTRRVT